MNDIATLKKNILNGKLDDRLNKLYADDLAAARERYAHVTDLFTAEFGDAEGARFFMLYC